MARVRKNLKQKLFVFLNNLRRANSALDGRNNVIGGANTYAFNAQITKTDKNKAFDLFCERKKMIKFFFTLIKFKTRYFFSL